MPITMPYKEAYKEVREWFLRYGLRNLPTDLFQKFMSENLIRWLPPVEQMSDLEIKVVFEEVLNGTLNWTDQVENGIPTFLNVLTISNYVRVANNSQLEFATRNLSEDEINKLITDRLGNCMWLAFCQAFQKKYGEFTL